ncbi:two component transcriptional regulator, winged helix family [mine drainage metagenome]|uniref:Transcriptional regulatory protein OmpR n=2 Tax=root TaxID=1 RepID=A0A149VYE2_9PROT|nr:two-component system response regulator OmpR [Ferrovum myxofaciens]KXW58196.1 transcriptional regulatory protein OmpR [Ferrovum myxofaciens]
MNTPRPRIIVLDDDLRLRELLQRYLSQQGFSVTAVPDALALDQALAKTPQDLLVLDLMLPGEDGLALCRRLRAQNNPIPIIMLTAKGNDSDRILGLNTGADDYLSKPFNPKELLARIQAVLRRQSWDTPLSADHHAQDLVTFGEFSFHLLQRTLHKNGELVALSSSEFSLLRALVTHPHEPLSREKLTDLVRGREREVFDRSIDVQISRLRRLLEEDPGCPRHIRTVWGIGYIFVPEITVPE